MSVKPDTDAHYYIVPRHSTLVLEVKDASTALDAPIRQNAAQANKPHQRFKFNPTRDGMYAIRCEASQHVFDVYGISKDDGAKVVQVSWHSGANQQFRLLDAGEGCVFIEATHSGKFVAVKSGSADGGAELVQRDKPVKADAHEYQFRLVLATRDVKPAALPTFKKPTDMLRDVGLGAIGLIPKAGGAFKFIVGAFWPDQSQQMFWDQMTYYVERYVDEKMTAKRIEDLGVALDGARKNLSDMSDMVPSAEKLGFFNSAYAAINQVDRAFFKADKAEKTLAYLIAMGTLKIGMLHEMTTDFASISDTADKNPTSHRRWLAEAVAEYAGAARAYRQGIFDRRMAKVDQRARVDHSHHTGSYWIRVVDAHNGADYRRRLDIDTDPRAVERVANELVASAKRNAQALFDAELDALLASTLLWNSYGAERPPAPRENVFVDAGPFGSDFNASQTLADRNHAIQGVRVYGGGVLAGIAIKSNGAWHSIGSTAGTPSEIELKDKERIVSVYGTADYRLMSIRFETNFGRRAGAGDDISAPNWSADVPADLEPTLVGVKASARPDGVEGVNLTWRYERLGGYPALPAAKRRGAKKKAVARKVAAKKPVTKAAKPGVVKKSTTKKVAAKKAIAKKAAVKKTLAKKPVARKPVAKKNPPKRSPARKSRRG